MNQEADGAILAGLVERVHSLLLGLSGPPRPTGDRGRVRRLASATDPRATGRHRTWYVVRVLRCAGDPVNYRILERLDLLNAVNAADLMPTTGLDRVAVSERLNDLAQVGLISQDLVDGQVRGTSLAIGVRALVERISVQAGGKLLDGLSNQEPRGDITEAGPEDLPV